MERRYKLLPYLIEYMFNPKVNLTRIPYISDYDQDMTWLSPKEKFIRRYVCRGLYFAT